MTDLCGTEVIKVIASSSFGFINGSMVNWTIIMVLHHYRKCLPFPEFNYPLGELHLLAMDGDAFRDCQRPQPDALIPALTAAGF
jgi:hypothetical protein